MTKSPRCSGLSSSKLSNNLNPPDLFLFKTREGGRGILQILGRNDKTGGLKIRYKLVQGGATNAAAIVPAAAAR